MKYFLHDTNSFDDEKITELYLKFGYEGLGLFYTTLEKIGKQEKPVKTTVLKAQLKVGKRLEKCWKFMEEIGLLSSNNGDTFNKQLLNFSEKYQIKKEKNKIKVAEWRKNQEDKENVTSYVPVSNPPKVNKSKVKENKINNIIPPTIEMVKNYCEERKNGIDAQYFIDQNTMKGWIYGKNKTPIKDWQACIRTWEKYSKKTNTFTNEDFN
jgi:hypothetical protein